jgi:hypothetical protein
MGSIPPGVPGNPFTLYGSSLPGSTGPVGINDEDWDGCVEDWFHQHPAFERKNYKQGEPAEGTFQEIWKGAREVQRILAQAPAPLISSEFDHPNHPARNPQQTLRKVVQRSGFVNSAVCLGLGRITWRSKVEYDQVWIEQCGLFLAICQLLEEKQGMPPGSLRKVFQEPQFEIEDRWILERIGGQTIIEHPEANTRMGEGSFVYAPHFGANWMFDTFLAPGCEPELLYTNTMHGTLGSISSPIVNSYFDNVYWSRDPSLRSTKANDMFKTVERFLKTRDAVVYWGAYSNTPAVKAAFANSSFYVRRPIS